MEVQDWILIGLLTFAVIFVVLFLFYCISFFLTSRKLSLVKSKRPRSKKKRKMWSRQVNQVTKQKKSRIKMAIICLLLGVCCGGAGLYTRYYQMTNLAERDSDALIQGYFLINTIEEQLSGVSEAESTKKVQATIYDLSARLASYGATNPDPRLSKDGRLLLKRLYQVMKELGLNLSGIKEDSLHDAQLIEEYLSDIEKVKTNQKNAFDYFRINESSLKQDT